jgi:hypothetical protein
VGAAFHVSGVSMKTIAVALLMVVAIVVWIGGVYVVVHFSMKYW